MTCLIFLNSWKLYYIFISISKNTEKTQISILCIKKMAGPWHSIVPNVDAVRPVLRRQKWFCGGIFQSPLCHTINNVHVSLKLPESHGQGWWVLWYTVLLIHIALFTIKYSMLYFRLKHKNLNHDRYGTLLHIKCIFSKLTCQIHITASICIWFLI